MKLVRIKSSILEILLPVTQVKMLLKTSQASIRLQSFYYLAINLIKFHSSTQIFRKNLKILQPFTNIALKRKFLTNNKNQFTSLDVRYFLIHHQLKFMMVNKVSTK